jgi:hypothetical protein
MIDIKLIPFNPSEIIEEGTYLVKTKTKYKEQYVETTVIQTGNKMSVNVTNQITTHISTKPL